MNHFISIELPQDDPLQKDIKQAKREHIEIGSHHSHLLSLAGLQITLILQSQSQFGLRSPYKTFWGGNLRFVLGSIKHKTQGDDARLGQNSP